MLILGLPLGILAQVAVTTGHYNQARTGSNMRERILNPANVRPGSFGFVGNLPVTGCVISQPLYVPNIKSRNVVYVATTANMLYAFDADTLEELVSRHLGTPVPSSEINPEQGYWDFPNCDGLDEQGPVGIVGTPVIDIAGNAIYLVTTNLENEFHRHFLHKLDLRTLEDLRPPKLIEGSYRNKQFDSYFQLQRTALLLAGGRIYVAFSSHTDATPYAGWMFAYDSDLNQVAAMSYSPERSGSGIWQSGAGPAFSEGKIYVTTGNNAEGVVNADDNADSILQIDPLTLHVMARTGFPEEAGDWDFGDLDLGSSRVIPVPGTSFVIAGSKYGDMFVMDRKGMQLLTRFQAVGRVSLGFDWTGIYNGMAVWKDSLFVWPGGGGWNNDPGADFSSDVMRSYRIKPDGSVMLLALGQDDHASAGYQGASLVVSSNGDDPESAIVWAAIPEGDSSWLRRGHLTAYTASSAGVFHTLWSDQEEPASQHNWAKFSQPLVANGRVYLPTFSGTVQVYGLLAKNPPLP